MFAQVCTSTWKRKKNLQLDLMKVNAKPASLSKAKVQPITDSWRDVTTKGPFYATALRKGKRPGMEDCAKTLYMPGPGHTLAAFGVFDGVESAGGYIMPVSGVMRVQGSLAITRGLGTPGYKQFIIPDPHVYSFRLCPLDQLLVLASDGLYMKMTNEEVRDVILRNLARPLDQLAALLADTAIERGSPDNVTVTLVDLRTSLTRGKELLVDEDELMADEPTEAPLLTPRHSAKFTF
jgi:hypothetical protein